MPKDRKVHLPLVGAERELSLPVPGGRGALTALLPAARRLSAEVMRHAVEAERAEGRNVSCKAGCFACCRQLIPVSVVEAKALAAAIARMPTPKRDAVRRRFAALLAKLEEHRLIEPRGASPRTALVAATSGGDGSERWTDVNARYVALRLECPFLEQGRCVVYEERPFVCREYLVTSAPALCDDLSPGVAPVPRPVYMTRALAEVAESLDGIAPATIPLPLMLEWLEAREPELGADHEGGEALEALLGALVWYEEGD